MNILKEVYSRRKHPMIYADVKSLVPTKNEIKEITGKAQTLTERMSGPKC